VPGIKRSPPSRLTQIKFSWPSFSHSQIKSIRLNNIRVLSYFALFFKNWGKNVNRLLKKSKGLNKPGENYQTFISLFLFHFPNINKERQSSTCFCSASTVDSSSCILNSMADPDFSRDSFKYFS
jgi:hypothetical protein